MSFGESVSTCFRKYADFTGRATRPEFWWFVLLMWVISAALFLVSIPSLDRGDLRRGFPVGFILLFIVSLGFLLPYLAVAVRRLHDTDK